MNRNNVLMHPVIQMQAKAPNLQIGYLKSLK